jgi:energy-coupling factor transport system permease protein
MDARGHGRTTETSATRKIMSGALVLLGLCGVCVGVYGLLDATTPAALGAPTLVVGVAAALGGLALAGRSARTTRYRPDPWRTAEWVVAASGLAVAVGLFLAGHVNPDNLDPSLQPLQWPTLQALPLMAILMGALPAWIAPPPRLASDRDPGGARVASPVGTSRVRAPVEVGS